MRQIETLRVIGITWETNKHYMVFNLVVDMLPTLQGPTFKSEMHRMVFGKNIHPEPVNPPTIRSFN